MKARHAVIICVVLVVVAGLLLAYRALSRPSAPYISREVRAVPARADEFRRAEAQAQETVRDIFVTVHAGGSLPIENPAIQPKRGNIYYALEVSIENNGQVTATTNRLAFSLRDDQGREYKPSSVQRDPQLPTQNLGENGQVHGWLTFEIPKNAEPDALIYQPFDLALSQVVVAALP